MIACRSLFRIDNTLKVTNNFVTSSSVRCFQRRYFYRAANCYLKIDIREAVFDRMDRKKSKKVSYGWRKVSTQSSSPTDMASQSIEFCDKGENKEMGDPTEGLHHGNSSISPHENEVEVGDETHVTHDKESLAVKSSPSPERHSQILEVGASLMRFIKGKWGATQRMIEDETGVKVIFPYSRKEDAITIEGNSAESVNIASRKIEAIVHEVVNSTRLDYSHFVSLPLAVHPELVDKLLRFQNSILGTSEADRTFLDSSSDEGNVTSEAGIVLQSEGEASSKQFTTGGTSIPLVSYAPKRWKASSVELKTSKLSDLGIDSSIFIKPRTFHLTVLMLKLWNKERLEAAAEVLQSVSTKVVDALDSRPISIRLKGLECTKGSFAKARVLYIPVEEVGGEGRLLRACQVIIDAFIEAGLVLERDVQHTLKLHATVMNVRHRKRQGQGQAKRWNDDFFDARKIGGLYGSMEWGEFVIPQAHLSERFAFDENGYYHCCTSIPFPGHMQQD